MTLWTLDFAEDAATARVDVRSRDGRVWTGNSNYAPLDRHGIHLCGQTDDNEQPTTVANYRMFSVSEAERAFCHARTVARCPVGDADFIVDLVVGGEPIDDFPTNRQLWPLAIDAWNTAHIKGLLP